MHYIAPPYQIEMDLLRSSLFIVIDQTKYSIDDIIRWAVLSTEQIQLARDIIDTIQRQIQYQTHSFTVKIENMQGVDTKISASEWIFYLTQQWVTDPLRQINQSLNLATPPSTAVRKDDQSDEDLWSCNKSA